MLHFITENITDRNLQRMAMAWITGGVIKHCATAHL
jgi:hypothetical protein